MEATRRQRAESERLEKKTAREKALEEEIERLRRELEKKTKENEENVTRQMKEAKIIDGKFKKKLERYKKEKDENIEEYKTIIEHLKSKNQELRKEKEI